MKMESEFKTPSINTEIMDMCDVLFFSGGKMSNMLYTSHVCVTLTSRIYFLPTLAQGKKDCTRGKGHFV